MRRPDARGAVPSWTLLAVTLPAVLALVASCSSSVALAPVARDGRVIQVVAAENFWGSIARQVGGRHVHVLSIISNPNTDPHSYEPTAADARAIALSRLVIENGVGYDPWMPRLLAADQGQQRVLDVGSMLGVPADGNPHRWYSPADVRAVISRLAAEYARIDPADKAYYSRRRAYVDTVALRPYHSLIATIRARYGGTPVGASESIFAMLAPALGLRLITPYSFLKAISEGTEVSVADKQVIDHQIRHHLIRIYVYNSQNLTPDVQAQLAAAKAAHIPVTTITETLAPPSDTFQAWQVRQLHGIEAALARAAALARTTGH
ncbi:MAG TPA: zinc ABC transporter substrate-binding protein [Streptosporangiaceae bacterium]